MRSLGLNLAAQLRQLGCPLALVARFTSAEVDAERSKLRRAAGLRSASEHIAPPRYLERYEPRCDDRRAKL